MPEGNYGRAQGRGHDQSVYATASLADGDTFDTGLSSVDAALADTRGNDAGSAGSLQIATVTSVSGGTRTIDYADIDATDGGSAQASAETIDLKADGQV